MLLRCENPWKCESTIGARCVLIAWEFWWLSYLNILHVEIKLDCHQVCNTLVSCQLVLLWTAILILIFFFFAFFFLFPFYTEQCMENLQSVLSSLVDFLLFLTFLSVSSGIWMHHLISQVCFFGFTSNVLFCTDLYLWWHGRCSDWAVGWTFLGSIFDGARDFYPVQNVQTACGAHPASCSVHAGGIVAGVWSKPLISIWCQA